MALPTQTLAFMRCFGHTLREINEYFKGFCKSNYL